MKPRVLVVEDNPNTFDSLRRSLESVGYEVLHADTEDHCLARTREAEPDIVVLDWWLREGDGLNALKSLRSFTRVPVLMLSARASTEDKVSALELGADDYLAKPFSPDELVARLRAVLRRHVDGSAAAKRVISLNGHGLRMDIETREVSLRERRVSLTPKEFRLLHYLVEREGTTVGRDELRRLLFASDDPKHDSAMDTHVSRLRRKVEIDPDAPRMILTVYSMGYRVEDLKAAPSHGRA